MAEHQQARTMEQDSRQYERRTPDSQKRLKPHRIATTGLLMLLPHLVDETAANDRYDGCYCQWRSEHLGASSAYMGSSSEYLLASSEHSGEAENVPSLI